MSQRIQKTAMAVAALGAIAVGASAIANAASNSASTNAGTTSKQGPRAGATNSGTTANQGARHWSQRGPGPGETLLTDGTADKVRQAALDKVPGATVLRVETDAQGSPYEAHLRKSDGSEVTVKVDKDFKATDVESFGGGPHGSRLGAY